MSKAMYGLEWSEPKTVNTKNGERVVRSAVPTKEFSNAWAANKHALKARGYALGKHYKTEAWEVTLWLLPGEKPEADREITFSPRRQFTAEETELILRIAQQHRRSLPADLCVVLGIEDDTEQLSLADDDVPF